ncbi:hypothetical protein TTHERM_000533999 (macronuclear) [Tetrahymena thermophila SB210]|uniref:Uncharacterized protein n=1 Tax=Tetrahymena thermophila (strain SB210) TaxID=312017 RepID=W7XDK5_TETTS|nr:hypothetical protein TTHERM_000533999 [Tetrahymena thermophila SB210]EWS71926.1 hypothetical protein TTHERM_000533999 [Tetrahymena thermophila SB210]|eukprot:XP_012655555.1 hypothetical protein TTHERM_000533999 [Tetrahymena thermophila SB210]
MPQRSHNLDKMHLILRLSQRQQQLNRFYLYTCRRKPYPFCFRCIFHQSLKSFRNYFVLLQIILDKCKKILSKEYSVFITKQGDFYPLLNEFALKQLLHIIQCHHKNFYYKGGQPFSQKDLGFFYSFAQNTYIKQVHLPIYQTDSNKYLLQAHIIVHQIHFMLILYLQCLRHHCIYLFQYVIMLLQHQTLNFFLHKFISKLFRTLLPLYSYLYSNNNRTLLQHILHLSSIMDMISLIP